MRLLCALGLFLALLHVTSCLLIGAFNIQNFGPKKFDKPEAIEIITEIVQRYDIILIQEVRDPDGTVTDRLLALVNQGSHQFRNISSEPLGPGSHKERYLFLYRDLKVTVTGSFQYTGKGFDRPPFVVKFSSTQTDVEFVLIPIHTSPLTAAQAKAARKKSTVQQLHALGKVVDAAEGRWTNTNIMVLGDFNAGTNYVTAADWENIPLFTEKGFHSLINDDVYTTMVESVQVHDRIVVSDDMYQGVVKAEVFDFIKAYHPEKAKEVSDHFPVEVAVEPPGKASKCPGADPPPTRKRKPKV